MTLSHSMTATTFKNQMKNTLVFIYNSFNDPLFQNLMLSYIREVAKENVGEFHLVTFEQERYRHNSHTMTQSHSMTTRQLQKKLQESNIYWHPLTFHTGRFLLLKKAWDLLTGFLLVSWLRIKHRTRIIFCFANVAASFGLIFSKIFRMKLMVYSYEPHSEFMADLGYWSRSGLKYRLLNWLEWQAGLSADVIMTGTQHMVDELTRRKSKAQLYRAPTAVDPADFKFNSDDRKRIRSALGLSNEIPVFIYVGKFGGLYYQEEIPKLFAGIKQHIPNAYFVVITSNEREEIRTMFAQSLHKQAFSITGDLSYDELKAYLSAADFGISGVPPSPSQKYRSPTKVAEYMLMGLPYITTMGVSEDDEVAEKEHVGAVLSTFSEKPTKEFYESLQKLLAEPKDQLRTRVRQVGLTYRSRDRIVEIFKGIYLNTDNE